MFKYSGIQSSKNQRYLLTVLIPVYNVQKWLDDCLKSLLTQTVKNVEYIFVNDGSTDKSGELLDCFARTDSRVKVIHLPGNEGLLRAQSMRLIWQVENTHLF